MSIKDLKKNLITQEGYNKLVHELEERKTSLRNSIALKIDDARKDGDLSENSAYTVAMEEKAFNDSRVQELELIIATSEIISGKSKGDAIGIGSKIGVKLNDEEELQYVLVGIQESDPTQGFISDQSPLGKEMVGKKRGQKINLVLPNGTVNIYEILSVN